MPIIPNHARRRREAGGLSVGIGLRQARTPDIAEISHAAAPTGCSSISSTTRWGSTRRQASVRQHSPPGSRPWCASAPANTGSRPGFANAATLMIAEKAADLILAARRTMAELPSALQRA